MADIGDNSAQRANVVVYRGTEPEVPAGVPVAPWRMSRR